MRQLALRVLPLVACALTACAGLPTATPATNVDAEQMAAIDRAAVRNGVRVLWINPPARKANAPGS